MDPDQTAPLGSRPDQSSYCLLKLLMQISSLKCACIYAANIKSSLIRYYLSLFRKLFTVMSPNIARPLTLRTSPRGYATFNQIKYFLIFNIRLIFEREKTAKDFHYAFSLLSRGGFQQKLVNVVKKLSDLNVKCHRLQIIYFESSN